MPKYETDCHCVGRDAHDAARQLADREFGTIDQIREKFRANNADECASLDALQKTLYTPGNEMTETELKEVDKKYAELERRVEKAWRVFLKPRNEFEMSEFEKHPDRLKPRKTCGFYTEEFLKSLREKHPEEKKYFKLKPGDRFEDKSGCAGTGRVESAYNPKSKWDFWSIGGRFTGKLMDGYDPADDPENWEPCWVCQGTGKRTDALGKEERKKDPQIHLQWLQRQGQESEVLDAVEEVLRRHSSAYGRETRHRSVRHRHAGRTVARAGQDGLVGHGQR